MEAIGQLTGGIAHDFNNILTVITGTIGILGEAVENSPDLAEIAQLITNAAARGAALTQHLLAFARKQPLQPIDVDVNRLMPKAIELLRPTIGGHINIEFVPEGGSWQPWSIRTSSRRPCSILPLTRATPCPTVAVWCSGPETSS